MATDKAQTLNNLRTKILNESTNNEGRNRFGLFSQPPAGVWGDGNYTFDKAKKLGVDGKPLTKPRGIYGGPSKTGKVESSYFSKPDFVTIGDKYVDPASIDRQYQNSKKSKKHEYEFKPANGTKSDPFTALYPHKTEHITTTKNHRGPDGKVVIQPRNIVTNPPKEGHGDSTIGHLLGETYPHKPDPYHRAKELAAKEREEHKKKLQEAPFRSVSHGGEAFISSKKTFGKDDKVLKLPQPKAQTPPGKLHETAFKPSNPSKQGYNKTINKFPEYKPDPLRIAVRKIDDGKEKKEPYRPNNTAFCERPTPSVSLNRSNLKKEMTRISTGYI